MSRQIGYARVSTDDLHGKAQKAALHAYHLLRPGIRRQSRSARAGQDPEGLQPGDTLVVARLERLGRSLIHLQQIMEDLEERRITARINSGIAAARKRGVVFGNPRLIAGDKAVIAKIVRARDGTHLTPLIDVMNTFMPTVLRMRPAKPWTEVAESVSRSTGLTWTVERLVRSVRRLVAEGMIDRKVLGRAPWPRRRRSEELAILVQGIALAHPGMSLRRIGKQLEAMKIQTPANKPSWTAPSVAHLLRKFSGTRGSQPPKLTD